MDGGFAAKAAQLCTAEPYLTGEHSTLWVVTIINLFSFLFFLFLELTRLSLTMGGGGGLSFIRVFFLL